MENVKSSAVQRRAPFVVARWTVLHLLCLLGTEYCHFPSSLIPRLKPVAFNIIASEQAVVKRCWYVDYLWDVITHAQSNGPSTNPRTSSYLSTVPRR